MSTRAHVAGIWLRAPAWDGLWMLCGLWLLPMLALALVLPLVFQQLLLLATALLWLAHRFASSYNAFCTPAYRALVRQQPGRFIIAPVALAALVFAFVFAPESLVQLDLAGRIKVLGTLFFLYNTYHFGIQHYGVLSIYRLRAGQPMQGRLRAYERWYCVLVGGLGVALGQIGHGAETVTDTLIYQFLPHEAVTPYFGLLQQAVPPLIAALSAALFIGECRQAFPSPPKLLYAAGVACQGVLAYVLPPTPFLFLWGVQHWIVSIGLSAHMAQRDRSDAAGSAWYACWGALNRRFWPAVGVLAAGSWLLAPWFDAAIHPVRLAHGASSLMAAVLTDAAGARCFVALSFASGGVHFLMDRAVFRFSNPAVRRVSLPLLLGGG